MMVSKSDKAEIGGDDIGSGLVVLVVAMRVAMVIMVVDSDGMLIVGVVVAMMSVMNMFRKNKYIPVCGLCLSSCFVVVYFRFHLFISLADFYDAW